MSRFEVSSVSKDDGNDSENNTISSQKQPPNSIAIDVGQNNKDSNNGAERIPLCDTNNAGLALYEEEYNSQGQKIGQMLRSLSLYQTAPQEDVEANAPSAPKQPVKMGTLMGVYFPCVQNIFGVLFFIRLAWIVGVAGIVEALGVVLLSCSVTFLTSISLSAIATNGVVSGGGPYYMISRNLGPELGGAIGILFFFGNTMAGAMYITGGVEILLIYLCPQLKLFESMHNNFRVFGSALLLCVGLVVLAGVKVVNKFALPALVMVLGCIACTFIGEFVKFNGTDSLRYCVVGDRPVNLVAFSEKHKYTPDCTIEGLRAAFCPNATSCDPYFKKVLTSNPLSIGSQRAITGFSSNAWSDNLWAKYREKGTVLTRGDSTKEPKAEKGSFWIFEDTTTSFMVLVGVYFPSVTGIMAGSNRSGNLRDAAVSIPWGTIGAQLTTSLAYIFGSAFFGMTVSELFIRDKYGESAMGKMIVAELAVPMPLIILLGCLASTIGAGMQSLTGAPRILQAIASDEVIPFLRHFKSTDRRGEPLIAIFVTLIICEVGILIAVLESLTALITEFLLMCYFGVNLSCAIQSLMKAPGWRPTFKYYHWALSFAGALLCLAIMFISSWQFAILAILMGIAVYKYIEYEGAEKEWGDGLKGLKLSAARYALLSVDQRHEQHSRNWRPQLLVLYPNKGGIFGGKDANETGDRLLSFVSQLKAGKGLTMVAECIEGDYIKKLEEASIERQRLIDKCQAYKIKGFCEVLVNDTYNAGINCLVQTSGLGGLRHNSVCICWPEKWSETKAWDEAHRFVSVIRSIAATKCAILVPKGINNFPKSTEKVTGTVDVWWIVHDGGLLMLLPFLLRKHRTWKNTTLRLFTIAHFDENSTQMKEDLEKFLYHLRIEGQVFVIDMPESDISEYTYEKTLKMEERVKFLREMKARERRDSPATMDEVVLERRFSRIERKQSSASNKVDSPIKTVQSPPGCVDIEEEPAANVGNKVRFSENSIEVSREEKPTTPPTPGTYNVRKMHTAVKLNELMRNRSKEAQLIVVNLPGPPEKDRDNYYMEFLDTLTDGLNRVLLVRGTGTEVITIYS
ncbi:unnamed protein product [Bursaphelenchus xylophilus]|uniref:(pine wood nematode) hypothetical protein n=1 Tax=Bursaphelenchus xylophilus TaxID=6326 RepID=A0A1I7RUF2_BURXY|nr:unnamed protein product [Bursaphelenchus xylophilus]CAG9114082.1 unnamed protein product [Bursaphelenchus xylophilus]